MKWQKAVSGLLILAFVVSAMAIPLNSYASPFGSDIFKGGFDNNRSGQMNAEYKVVAGDRVALKLWGQVELERSLTVDTAGNVFIPQVGPVKVKGLNQSQLQSKIQKKVSSYYGDEVDVYALIENPLPIHISVTGFVNSPGLYAGDAVEGPLYFLSKAGGISEDGSFREVNLIRKGKKVAEFDLYQLYQNGVLPAVDLKSNDTLFVTKRKPVVLVQGEIEIELVREKVSGKVILEKVNFPEVTNVLLESFSGGEKKTQYLSIGKFEETDVYGGDKVFFKKDVDSAGVTIKLEGSFKGESIITVDAGAKLIDILKTIRVDKSLADYSNIYLKRELVAKAQAKSIEKSLNRLEESFLRASSDTKEESMIRAEEAKLISSFVERARSIQPDGRMTVSESGEIRNITLLDGDVIVIPERTDTVQLTGEVLIPQTVVFNSETSVEDYIKKAGGLRDSADSERIMVVKANGEVFAASDYASIQSGDEIMVLPKTPVKNIQAAMSITQIMYQVAVAAKVMLDL